MPEPGSFGTRVRLARQHAGLSQEQLARAAGVSVGTVARIEQGVTSSLTTRSLEGMCKALGVTSDYLLGLSEKPADTEDLRDTPLPALAVES